MKTISEMQLLIKDAYSKLDELSKNLSEYNLSSDVNMTVDFEKLKVLGKRNPIEGHALSKADQLTKKYYITLLMALVYLAMENQEKGWLLIQRIACGAEMKHELSDLSADALSLTDKQFDSLSESIIFANLRTVFALDCMLVYLSCEHKNKKMLDFISELMELVKCTKDEVKEAAELSSLIATQNITEYFAKSLTNISVNVTEGLGYILPTKVAIVSSLKEAMLVNKEYVFIFNAMINNVDSPINNCIFKQCLGVDTCSDSYLIEISNGYIKECIFEQCSNTTNERRSPTIVGIVKLSQGRIQNTKFINCKSDGRSSYGTYATYICYILFLSNSTVEECEFTGCSCTADSPSCKYWRNYIIGLKDSNQIKNKFTECSSYQYEHDRYKGNAEYGDF